MKYSDITIEDKEVELLKLISDFSKNIISDIDKIIKETKPKLTEAPFVDLTVEAYHSIQAFCCLLKEGLVSSASAIFRIIVEQVSIIRLLVNNKEAKERFVNIKIEQNKYYLASDKERKVMVKNICEENGINDKKIKQYFDYGWCKLAGCESMSIKSICKEAGTQHIYRLVEDIINGFSHGQRSIYQFYRRQNGVDKMFIRNICQYTFQLFFVLVGSTVTEYGERVVNVDNKKIFAMSQALYFDVKTRLSEKDLLTYVKNNDFSAIKVEEYYELIYRTTQLLDVAVDSREKHFLSQAYIRLVRQAIVYSIASSGKYDCSHIDSFKLFDLFEDLKPSEASNYKSNFVISLPNLLKMIDSADDDWELRESEIDYQFTYSVNTLLEAFRPKD